MEAHKVDPRTHDAVWMTVYWGMGMVCTLEEAHATAHALQADIGRRLRNADVLIHLEPEDRVRPGQEIPSDGRAVNEG